MLSLLYVVVLTAQEPSDPLQDYLKATPEQWRDLSINASAHRLAQREPFQRLDALNREVAAETLKPTLNPTELGQRYRQIEDLCRSLVPPRVELYRKQLEVLTPDQRALLPPIADSLTLVFIDVMAQSLLLRPTTTFGLDLSQNGTSYSGPSFYFDPRVDSPKLPTEIVTFLDLTESQQDQIRLLHLDYRRYFDTNFARMREVGAEIEKEFAIESYSPDRIGAGYAEIESIRRRIAERESSLRRDLSSLLTQPQQDRIASLEQARSRSLLKFRGDSLFLFPRNERPRPASTAGLQSAWFPDVFSRTDGTISGSDAADTIFRYCKDDGLIFSFVATGQ